MENKVQMIFKFILLLKCFCATVCKQAVYLKIKLNLYFLKMEVSLQKDWLHFVMFKQQQWNEA